MGKMDSKGKSDVIFSVNEDIGALAKALKIFEGKGVGLTHIESRPSKTNKQQYEILVTCESTNGHISDITSMLKEETNATVKEPKSGEEEIPWFPRRIEDLDEYANKILTYGSELDADHPGFTDQVYRARRKEFADIAFNYKHGQPIPRVKYTKEEIDTWGEIYRKLTELFPTHACKEFNNLLPVLKEECGYREDNIPQLEDVSQFLQKRSGFRIRPVAGLLSSRDFLAGLAFRVFHSTQYIRHSSHPSQTPEPDICHELIGHISLLADPAFARFSQEIGLASLGAPDEWVTKLATCYWFTVEFGICRQDGQLRAYGAGLLSSFGELQYALSGEPEVREFEPEKTAVEPYPITNIHQDVYFVAESFEDAKDKLQKYCDQIPRPFVVRYDAYTQQVEVLDKKDKLMDLALNIQSDLSILREAIKRTSA